MVDEILRGGRQIFVSATMDGGVVGELCIHSFELDWVDAVACLFSIFHVVFQSHVCSARGR